MKRRTQKILNFFAFNLLFFALYLNFIHKDKVSAAISATTQQNASAINGILPVESPEKYVNTKTDVSVQHPVTVKTEQENSATSKSASN